MHTSHLIPVLETSTEMKTFLLLLVLGYASSDKLDLTYLPPPGSQYAGGRPGDIQIPLEFPKETQSTTFRPQSGDNLAISPESYKPTIGIDRVPGPQNTGVFGPGPQSPNVPVNQRVPTTTVSYAFTQTTTHPPTEGFETTIGPQGYPSTDVVNNYPSQESGLVYQGGNAQNRPGYQQTANQFGQRPTFAPTSGPAYDTVSSQQPSLDYGVNLNQNQPGYQETVNQFGSPTSKPTLRPDAQFTGSSFQPSTTGQQFSQNYPISQQGNQYQPGRLKQNQFRNQSFSDVGSGRPGFVSTTSAPQGIPSSLQPGITTIDIGNTGAPGSFNGAPQGSYLGQQIPTTNFQPESNLRPNQILPNQQNYVNGQITNQRFPGSQSFNNGAVQLPSSTVAPTYTPGVFNQQYAGSSVGPDFNNEDNAPGRQQYTGSQQFTGRPANNQNAFQPSSTVLPDFSNQNILSGTVSSGLRDQQFPTSSISDYSTPRYPGAEASAASTVYKNRPERPQAAADRNAVILNYENEITPEGFAYSFDTSNGIHADENGTAIDGVKAQGSYSYTGDDGKFYSIIYTADENGFRPRGDHLPTAPPVPEAIQRVIEQAEKDKAAGITHDGSYDEDKYGHKKYQGAYNRRPKPADKISSTNTEFTDNVLPGTVQDASQRLKPKEGQRKPINSADRQQYNDDYSETDMDTDSEISKDFNRNKPTQPQRPTNRVNAHDSENEEEYIEDDLVENQGTTGRPFVSTRRPINQSDKKQYNNMYIPGAGNKMRNENRKRPNVKVTSNPEIDEDQDTGVYAEPEYKDDVRKDSFVNKGTSRQPVNFSDKDEYENEDSTGTENYGKVKASSRPLPTRKPLRRPGSNIGTQNEETASQQSFDKYGRPVSGNGKNYNKQRFGTKRPSKPLTNDAGELQTVTEDYDGSVNFEPTVPSKETSGKTSTLFNTRDRTTPNRMKQRPTPYTPKESTDENTAYQPEESEDYIESDTDENVQPQDYYKRRPTKPSGVSEKGDKYDENNPESGDLDTTDRDYTNRPEESLTVYNENTGRPQISQRPKTDGRIKETGEKRKIVLRPGTKFEIARPGFSQNTDIVEDDAKNINETGYQYIPPQRKFDLDEVKVTPNRFKGTTRRPFTGRPDPNDYYRLKNEPGKPFMTPNVASSSEKPEEDGGISKNENEQENQYDESSADGTTPDQTYDDDENTSTQLLNQFPTKRPNYQQPTVRPTYSQNVPSYTKEGIKQKGRPVQDSISRYFDSTNTPQKISSSTTPMPSTRVQVSTKPGQRDELFYSKKDGARKPGQVSISASTPFSSQGTTIDGSDGDNQYQTTYRPPGTIRPATGYEDRRFDQRLPTGGPNSASINITPDVSNNRYQADLPSTTYRPSLITGQNQPSSTTKPSVLVDRYGRPINKPGFDTAAYGPGNKTPSTVSPKGTIDVYGRPVSGFDATAQEYIPGDQNVPSSTATPGVLVDAFGRPVIRPGSGTTVQEYVPTSGNEIPSTIRPSVNIDVFGRPVPTFGLRQPSSTAKPEELVDAFGRPVQEGAVPQGYRPGGQQQSTSSPRVTIDAYGRPVTTIGVTPSEYTRVYSAPSGSQPGQFIERQPTTPVPGSQFRGNQFQTSSMRPGFDQSTFSTFRPSTERIIGEDFSGPKQQQKFDPEHGYYY